MMGLPLTNPALEGKLKAMGFWPEAARPLDFDIADLLYMQPRQERATAYGLMMGLAPKDIARQLGFSVAMIYNYRDKVQTHLHKLAEFFGATGAADPGEEIEALDVVMAIGAPCNLTDYWLSHYLGIPVPTVTRRELPAVWAALPRMEELPISYVWGLRAHVSEDTRRTYFPVHLLSEPQQPVAPGPEWLTEEQAIAYLGIRQGALTRALDQHQLTPHLIPFYKGAWFNRADLDAFAASF